MEAVTISVEVEERDSEERQYAGEWAENQLRYARAGNQTQSCKKRYCETKNGEHEHEL